MENRDKYFDYIEGELSTICTRIKVRGKLNLLNYHVHAENFFARLLNLIYGHELKDANLISRNIEGIDLIDDTNKIIAQVSATASKQKLESSLSKEIIGDHKNYSYKFIAIVIDASALKKDEVTIANPHNISFSNQTDIYDITTLLNRIKSGSIEKIKEVHDFLRLELDEKINLVKLDSGLAHIINILSAEPWSESNGVILPKSFDIENKITHNNLQAISDTIREFFIFSKKVNEKYKEFEKMGVNKGISVMRTIQREYQKTVVEEYSGIKLFFVVTQNLTNKVIMSDSLISLTEEEVTYCVEILVVDAFIKCKIFNNPAGYTYAST